METTKKKAEFVSLRAAGQSFNKISKELNISKSTCSKWEAAFKKEIAERKKEQLEEVYNLYGMQKESRIKRLGETLRQIDEALAQKDLAELPPDVLLKIKLQYEQELKGEYIEPTSQSFTEKSIDEVIDALISLYQRQASGELSPAQAKAQLETLTALRVAETERDNNW